MNKRVKVLQEVYYDGKNRVVGDIFDAAENDANILSVIGKVEIIKIAEPKSVIPEKQDAPKLAESETPSVNPRRRYQRRDMKAEE